MPGLFRSTDTAVLWGGTIFAPILLRSREVTWLAPGCPAEGPGLRSKPIWLQDLHLTTILPFLPSPPKCVLDFQIVLILHYFRKGEEMPGCLCEEKEIIPKGERRANSQATAVATGWCVVSLKSFHGFSSRTVRNLLTTAQKLPMVMFPYVEEHSLKWKPDVNLYKATQGSPWDSKGKAKRREFNKLVPVGLKFIRNQNNSTTH